MLQRIQSVFYFLTAITFAALFKLPFATSDAPIPQYMDDQVYNVQDHIVLLGLSGAAVIIGILAIFLYKNRVLQLRFGYLLITLAILIPLVAFLLLYTEKTALNSSVTINDNLGLYIPIVAIIFAFLANRFVKKDDKLVKSMDRLR
jgi:hypothetical protein